MVVTVNISDILIQDLETLKYLQHYEKNFLSFSYYTGYIIAAFNFALFLLAMALYIQVVLKTTILGSFNKGLFCYGTLTLTLLQACDKSVFPGDDPPSVHPVHRQPGAGGHPAAADDQPGHPGAGDHTRGPRGPHLGPRDQVSHLQGGPGPLLLHHGRGRGVAG